MDAWPFAVVFVIMAIAIGVVLITNDDSDDAPCIGVVTDKFTEYVPGVNVNAGSVSIPTGSTKYALAIKRDDGSFCSRRLRKSDWLGVQEGDHIG